MSKANKIFALSLAFMLVLNLVYFVVPETKASASTTYYRGVNLAGPDFNAGTIPGIRDQNFTFNEESCYTYYSGKGLKIIRVPVIWARLQPSLYGTLDTTYLNGLKENITWAKNHSSKVIIDVHDYGRYRSEDRIIDASDVTRAHFADLWVKLSNEFKNETGVYAYDLMNEPHDMGTSNWKLISQAAVTAIRNNGDNKLIMVEGDSWASAAYWGNNNGPTSWISDPANNFKYSAHVYFDNNRSGTYGWTYDQELAANPNLANVGAIRVADFINWCASNNVQGYIGEFGIPNNDSRWNTVLENFYDAIDQAGMDATYWAGGTWWGDYSLSCQPINNYTTDAPQMSVIASHLGGTTQTPAALPTPWATGDINSPIAGNDSYSNGVFSVAGCGSDIYGTSDQFRYVYQPMSGDCTIIARVTNIQNTNDWAKAGVMIRETLNTGSKDVVMGVTQGHGTSLTYRNTTDGSTSDGGSNATQVFPRWVKLVRSGSTFTGYSSSDGSSWSQIGTTNISMTSSVYVGLAVSSHNTAALNTSTFDNVTASSGSALPTPWLSGDIAAPITGDATYASGVFSVTGCGSDIYGTSDQFRYVYQPMNGDCTIIARVNNIQNTNDWARAGVMVRETLDSGSKDVVMGVTQGHGTSLTYRNTTDGSTSDGGSNATQVFPRWVKLVRSGSTFTGYSSSDGSSWSQIGTTNISMTSSVYVGLAVSSHNTAALNTSTFDNVTASSGSALPTPWLSGDIAAPITGDATYASGVFSITGSGNDIYGTGDQFRYVYQPMNGDCTIIAKVTNIQNTNDWARAGVMIRETLNTGSKNVVMGVTQGHGTSLTYRNTTDGSTGDGGSNSTQVFPRWVKLVRSGSTFTGYSSSDGTNWGQIGSTNISMNSSVYVGLAVSSHNTAALNTSTFESVSVQ